MWKWKKKFGPIFLYLITNLQLQHLILNTLHIKLKEDFVVITKKLWWKNNKKLIKKRKLIINNVHVRQLVVNNRTNKREIHQNSKIDKATSPIPHIVAPEHSILNEIVNNTLKNRNSRRWSLGILIFYTWKKISLCN